MNTRQLVVIVAFAMFCSCCLTGCGSSGESLTRQQINLMNQLADEYESGGNEKSIEKIAKKMEVLRNKMKSLDLSVEEQMKIGQKYQEELLAATQRLFTAAMKHSSGNLPGIFDSMSKPPGN